MNRILVVEDEPVIRRALHRLLQRQGYQVTEADCLSCAIESDAANAFDLIITDLRLPDGDGTTLLEHCPDVPVLVMTSYASVPSAVDAMKRGAVDYIAKPFDHEELLLLIERTLHQRRIEHENDRLRSDLDQSYPVKGMIGNGNAMRRVCAYVEKVAKTDSSVLIRGESGTGKELVARAIHDKSGRAKASLVVVNCAAIPENLIEAELFGYERGAFTGAVQAHRGLIEAADGGTLFLDEIGELMPAVQSKLLRVLQDGEMRRVGANSVRKVDIRLLAATHRDLERMVRSGVFREDLYYRIRVMEIQLPPLRDRPEDLPALSEFLLAKACRRLKRSACCLSPEALRAIEAYHWPGNVRELENALERAAILAEGRTIAAEYLGLPMLAGASAVGQEALADVLSLDDYFRHFVLEHQDRMTETEMAQRLGISRKSLWERRQRMGIARGRTA